MGVGCVLTPVGGLLACVAGAPGRGLGCAVSSPRRRESLATRQGLLQGQPPESCGGGRPGAGPCEGSPSRLSGEVVSEPGFGNRTPHPNFLFFLRVLLWWGWPAVLSLLGGRIVPTVLVGLAAEQQPVAALRTKKKPVAGWHPWPHPGEEGVVLVSPWGVGGCPLPPAQGLCPLTIC